MKKKIKKKKIIKRKVVRKPKRYQVPRRKQEKLVMNYLNHYNSRRAAKESGYSYSRAMEIIKSPEMQEYIQKKHNEYEKQIEDMRKKVPLLAMERMIEILSSKLDKAADTTALSLGIRLGGMLEPTEAQKEKGEIGKKNLLKWIESVKKRDKK